MNDNHQEDLNLTRQNTDAVQLNLNISNCRKNKASGVTGYFRKYKKLTCGNRRDSICYNFLRYSDN